MGNFKNKQKQHTKIENKTIVYQNC